MTNIMEILAIIAGVILALWVMLELSAIRQVLEWMKSYFAAAGEQAVAREEASREAWLASQQSLMKENRDAIMQRAGELMQEEHRRRQAEEED